MKTSNRHLHSSVTRPWPFCWQEEEARQAQEALEQREEEARVKEEEARRLQEELEDARRKMEENQRALSEVLAPPVVHVTENDVEESHEENMEGGEWRGVGFSFNQID